MNANYVNPAPLLNPAEQARAVAANLASGTNNAITNWLGGMCPVQPYAPASSLAALTIHPFATENINALAAAATGTLTVLVTVPGSSVVYTVTFTGRQDFDCLRAFTVDSWYSKLTLVLPGNVLVTLRLAEVDYLRAVLAESGASAPDTTSDLSVEGTVQPPNAGSPEFDPNESSLCTAYNAVNIAQTHDVHIYAGGPMDQGRPQQAYPIEGTSAGGLEEFDPQGEDPSEA